MHFASKSCVILYWQRYYTALDQWASAKLCGVVVSSRDRAAISFDIGRSNCLVVSILPHCALSQTFSTVDETAVTLSKILRHSVLITLIAHLACFLCICITRNLVPWFRFLSCPFVLFQQRSGAVGVESVYMTMVYI